MWLIRPVCAEDLDGLMALARAAGPGLTTLPVHKVTLARRIAASEASFATAVTAPGKEQYLLVMEDTGEHRLIGTAGVYGTVGLDRPFYNYRLFHLTQESAAPKVRVDTKVLQLVNDYAGKSELGTLFLHPAYRRGGAGRFLSLVRFLLMACDRKRFAEEIVAEIRGWVDANGESPFWNAVGKHFFHMDFFAADRLSGLGNSQFIGDLMPKFPIYMNLLPATAQEVIGRPHDQAAPALSLLESQGFRRDGAVDVFDAGPCVMATVATIRTIRTTRRATVVIDTPPEKGGPYMVSNGNFQTFRAVRVPHASRSTHIILREEETAALGVSPGDRVQVAPLAKRRG